MSINLLTEIFTDNYPGFFVNVGAGDGVCDNVCYHFEQTASWCGINIEKCPVKFRDLCLNRTHCTNLNCEISTIDSVVEPEPNVRIVSKRLETVFKDTETRRVNLLDIHAETFEEFRYAFGSIVFDNVFIDFIRFDKFEEVDQNIQLISFLKSKQFTIYVENDAGKILMINMLSEFNPAI